MARKRVPTSTEAGFLGHIVEQIDDVPRLVYADWLEDNGQPRRAEFIRLQCRLAGMGEDDAERPALLEREWELLHVYQRRWAPAWPAAALREPHEFRRGFPAVLSLTRSQFRQHAGKLFSASPLEEIHLRAVEGRLAEVLSEPLLARLRTLHLGGNELDVDDLRALAACTHLTRLKRLNLERTMLTSQGAAVLAGWPGLAQVTHLDLCANPFDGNGLAALLESPYLSGLTSLNLDSCYQVGACVGLLGSFPRLNTVTHLSLRGCRIGPSTVRSLALPSGLKALRSLDLSGNPLTVEGALFLIHSSLLPRLTTLGMANGSLPKGAIAALAKSPHTAQLRRLDLLANSLGDDEVKMLAGARLDSLEHLNLVANRFSAEGAGGVSRSPRLGRLATLNLNTCRLGPAGVDALTASTCLTSLIHLDLGYNQVHQGAKALSRWPNLGRVRVLLLNSNNLNDEDIQALARSPYVTELRRLGLQGNHLTNDAASALAESPHLQQLRWLRMATNRGLTMEGDRTLAASPNLPHLLELQVGRFLSENLVPLLHEHGKGVEL